MLIINLDRNDKNADWLHSLKTPEKVLKSKIYLKPQEKPPEGVRVQRGPKGGLYYESQIGIKKPKQINFSTSFKSNSPGKIVLDVWKDVFGVTPDSQILSHAFTADGSKTIFGEVLTSWSIDNSASSCRGLGKIFSSFNSKVDFHKLPKEYKIKDILSKVSLNDIKKIKNHAIELVKKDSHVKKTKDGKIILYRGISKKLADQIKQEYPMVEMHDLSSWSANKSVAKKFATRENGIVVKAEFDPEDVGLHYTQLYSVRSSIYTLADVQGFEKFFREHEIVIHNNKLKYPNGVPCEVLK